MLSAMSGIPGGVFSPSLAIGAGEASALHLLFPHLALSALALICMVAYLTGSPRRRSPLSSSSPK